MSSNRDGKRNFHSSLGSIESGDGDKESSDIPYADDDSTTNDERRKSSESRSSIESIAEKPNITPRRRVAAFADATASDDDTVSHDELRDKPSPLASEVRFAETSNLDVMRRNSISMPTLNDSQLDALRALHMKAVEENDEGSKESLTDIKVLDNTDSMACSIADIVETEAPITPEEEPMFRKKFRTKRRNSINPLPAIRVNGEIMVNAEYDDTHSMNSNAQSITSINSLASLLKEKIQSLPTMIRKRKKPKDYKLRAFTAFLFLVIVFLVGYAYIMYNRKVTSRLYFDHIKFNGVDRLLHILDAKEKNVFSGNLGVPLFASKPFSCKDKPKDGSFCWEWTRQAKLYVNLDSKFTGVSSDETPSSRCYTFQWESIDENFEPIDCFNIGEERGQWYGGGLTRDADWQLDQATFSFAPFISGDIRFNQWSNAVRRYFINSHGVALEVDEATPLHISINEEYPSQFCLKSQHDSFAFVNRPTPTTELKYRICTASDMKILHHNLTQKNLWDGLKEDDISVIKRMFDEPVWEVTGSLTDVSILNFTDSVFALGYFRLGHILINEQWQRYVGDYEIDEERFKALNDTINILHRRGFRISLTIQPFVSTESKNFIELLNKKLLVYERSTARSIPALTKFKNAPSVGVLDPTNNETIPWLLQKIDKTVNKYLINSFFVEFGSAYDMPRFYECQSPLLNPDHYKTIFMSRISESMNLLGVSGAISVPRPPAFLNLPKVNSSWEGLQMVITSALNYGIIGYPFIMSGAVGGDYITLLNGTIQENTPLPDKELYIRWLQLTTFLPVMRFTHLPSDYKDERVTEIAKELSAIRQKTVTPILKKYLNDAMNEGLPLIRPLWMLDPQDVACLNVIDEFSVGEQLIVAPILERQKTLREVYLPQGVWKDGVDGSLRKGSRWIHNYRVPDDKIAYFVKMPDNTRF